MGSALNPALRSTMASPSGLPRRSTPCPAREIGPRWSSKLSLSLDDHKTAAAARRGIPATRRRPATTAATSARRASFAQAPRLVETIRDGAVCRQAAIAGPAANAAQTSAVASRALGAWRSRRCSDADAQDKHARMAATLPTKRHVIANSPRPGEEGDVMDRERGKAVQRLLAGSGPHRRALGRLLGLVSFGTSADARAGNGPAC
jgi:hypothetical protein